MRKKVYHRQKGEFVEGFWEGCFANIVVEIVWGGSTLFWHTVVGCDTYSKNTKMGVGKRPDATVWETYIAKICL